MKNTTNIILKYSIITGLALIAFIPLYVSNSLFFPFITGKAFAFRIIVEIIFALWLVLVLREKGTSTATSEGSVAPRINALTVSVTIFTIVVLVADLLGYNPLRSIWSNFERMEGWMTVVHLWAYFMVLSSVINSKENWHKFFNVVLVGGLIIAIYGLFQFFSWASIHQGSTRVDASLGNSAYMAVYMLINAFIALYMACVEYCKNILKKKESKGLGFSFLVWMYSVLFVLFSFILFETATRGTILGWIAGILVACAFYVIFGRSKIENKKDGEIETGQSGRSRMFAGGIIVLFVVIGVLFYFNRDAKWIQNNETLGRLASISLNDTKTQARGYIWPMAVKDTFGSVKTSIIGIGQENFNYIFNKEYNPKMWAHEQWFDRAHSVFLDWLVAGGLLGFILYLSLYVISFIYIWKSDLTIGQKSMLMALVVGYGIHNVFVFDNQTSYVMFFTILAFLSSITKGKEYSWLGHSSKEKSEDAIVVRDYIFIPVIVLASITSFYFINVRNIQANTRLIDALRACSNGGNPSAELYAKALSLDQTTANQEIREQLINCASSVIGSKDAPIKMKNDFYTLTKSEIEKQISTTPNDARIYVIGGSFFNAIGDFTTALPILEKARALTPGKQSVAFDLATNYMNIGKAQEAVDITKKAYESAPDYRLAKSAYVVALINAGEEKKARELFPNDPDLFTGEMVINVYFKNKQYNKVIEIYKGIIAKNPDDPQTHLYLASAYMANKQSWLAIAELKIVKEKYPQAKEQIDEAIKQIEEGKNPLQ